MTKLKTILENRFKKKPNDQGSQKMRDLVHKRIEGELSPFSGIFQTKQPSQEDHDHLRQILQKYSLTQDSAEEALDLPKLISLSAEIKEIHRQAILLHGERISKAREILKKYREGAFSAWLLFTYGNRQTPYNFLVYYELYTSLPDPLKREAEKMPKQALYTLASRNGSKEKKEEIIRNYCGETKDQILSLIRKEFPLEDSDERRACFLSAAIKHLEKASTLLKEAPQKVSKQKFSKLNKLLKKLETITNGLTSDD
ncbi:CT583 family protein [Chlamydiifrater phoenicopteri]|uniref:CT583 family protein n=1 Tax=Chlamydiifrater phoenicopteri TaxID=2681469 RepID=UPI001BD1214B|nr:CT583 family protein [Chlamydiifrater phoenicopteri]